ncbi:MAG TPA: Clp protease N-terminal domain-containing protein [Acidimicrobiales bacterium]
MDVDLEQLIASVEDGTDDPLDQVSSAALLKDQFEQLGDDLLDHFVTRARSGGCSWTQIGEALGVTRQAAQQRHGGLLDRLAGRLKDGLFKRFTPRARVAVGNAQEAARARGDTYVGTEHVLLGLFAADDQNVAVQALDRLGASHADIERLVDARVPPGTTPVKGHIPFTPRAKKSLDLALREALALGHNYIGTEHIVLGLRRVEDGIAAQVLAELGVAYDELRATVVKLLLGRAGNA